MPRLAQYDEPIARTLSGPSGRPLVLRGRSGCGKTTLVRRASASTGKETVWLSAFDLATGLAAAIREGRHGRYCDDLVADARPLCIEHMEDLRGRPRTRTEVQRLLQRAAESRPVVLTLTRSPRDREVTLWLRSWTDLVALD